MLKFNCKNDKRFSILYLCTVCSSSRCPITTQIVEGDPKTHHDHFVRHSIFSNLVKNPGTAQKMYCIMSTQFQWWILKFCVMWVANLMHKKREFLFALQILERWRTKRSTSSLSLFIRDASYLNKCSGVSLHSNGNVHVKKLLFQKLIKRREALEYEAVFLCVQCLLTSNDVSFDIKFT